MRARVAAFMLAARRAPSRERMLRAMWMVEWGNSCVKRVEEKAEEMVDWISAMRLGALC